MTEHGPRVLDCPNCGGPVRYEVPFCAYCRAPLTWDRPITLERGALIKAERYPQDPLLGGTLLKTTRWEPSPDGYVVHLEPKRASWAQSKLQAADLSVCVEGVALDRDAAFGVSVRAYSDGPILGGYVAMVAPGFRSVRLMRLLEGGEVSSQSVLMDWVSHPCVAPVGQPNQVELRTADTVIQLHVNGIRMLSTSDPGLGFGRFGWRAGSMDRPATVLLRKLEVFEVKAG